MYDASGVRLHAGRQAEVSSSSYEPRLLLVCCLLLAMLLPIIVLWFSLQLLNQIVCELPTEHPLSNIRPLRDSLGHTPLQVCCNLSELHFNC
jgi:acid phosphatase family membrane protein YuiD